MATNEQEQHHLVNSRFPHSNTVHYSAYAALEKSDEHRFPTHYYYTDYPTYIHGTVSPTEASRYLNTREPLSAINSNFQPISPHHQQYSNRPVDIVKPTFLLVPKEAEQQLTARLAMSNPSTLLANSATKSSSKPMTKETNKKVEAKRSTFFEPSSPTTRHVEVQTNKNSSNAMMTPGIMVMDHTHQHVGTMATPNPSPYVHFVNASQSPQFLQDGPPETTIMNDRFVNMNDYYQSSSTIRSMPNMALRQGMNKNKNQTFL